MSVIFRLPHRIFCSFLPGCVLLLTLAAPQLTRFSPRIEFIADPPHQRTLELIRTQGAGESAPVGPPLVALTFDDLPGVGPLPKGMTRVEIVKSIIGALQAAHVPPVYGFVNAKGLQGDPAGTEVLQVWRAAGFPLANHAFSHMDLNINSVADFEQDVLANEPTLTQFMGTEDWHWLRYPFLREGNTPEKHLAVLTFLKDHAYKVAQVTISFGDYAYNVPYARCVAKNNQRGIARLKKSYLQGAAESLDHSKALAEALFGRDINHVMLLHDGGFETVMLPHLLELLKHRGYRLVTLPEAQSDPAFAMHPDLPGSYEGSFLDQLVKARHISVPADLANASLADLDAVCR